MTDPSKGDQSALRIGQRVKKHRKKAGLSLEQLARLSGVSAAMLSQIEQEKANPTVAVVWKIARALHVDLSELLEDARVRHRFQVIRADDERYLFSRDQRCTVRTLSPLNLEKDVEFYQIDLAPGGSLDSDPHFHNTEEILCVASGRITVRSLDHEVNLAAGDSVHYSADVNHSISNPGPDPATTFLVVKYRGE
ncbi:MAG: helix-turn-helix domain-containing protein [Phycisphaerae bacterium]|nr:helix-turn-helix domain-containing protein [Phycisphaerae bacterium]